MPYKFRKHVPKGFSRKARKANKALPLATSPSAIELCDAEVQTEELTETADTETQTNEMSFTTVGVQTDKNQVKVAESQTDTTEVCHVEVQTDHDELLTGDEPSYCIGNNDDKFIPLITKHKGVFKDSTGM